MNKATKQPICPCNPQSKVVLNNPDIDMELFLYLQTYSNVKPSLLAPTSMIELHYFTKNRKKELKEGVHKVRFHLELVFVAGLSPYI